MTGPENYAEAERLLDGPDTGGFDGDEFDRLRQDNLAAAQVHALLALTAAVISTVESHPAATAWREVLQ